MTVFFEDAVLNDAKSFINLDMLTKHFYTQRHRYDFASDNPDRLINSHWLKSDTGRWGQLNLSFYEKGFTDDAYRAADKAHLICLRVGLTTAGPDLLSTENALIALNEPARVLRGLHARA